MKRKKRERGCGLAGARPQVVAAVTAGGGGGGRRRLAGATVRPLSSFGSAERGKGEFGVEREKKKRERERRERKCLGERERLY